ncbi:hypothetical protein [Terracoccus sp. 273MFTsu3.1]|uniref:hypothetical protein n=1 Tax=Terracoccus sp. 273MFTsu3.1 TaxID=1172188 RepID=UPI0003661617|nr:hypothetical protein [Terracoccus sp. 273MFTsu3.1]
MSEIYVDKDGQKWRTPTKEELAKGHAVREAVESLLESWAPNYMESGRVSSYDEWIERVEGLEFPTEPDTKIELGSDTSEHPYTTIKRIAKAVAADLR